MTRVAIIGAGQTPFDARPDVTLKGLFAAAVGVAVDDVQRGFDPQEIEEAHIGSLATGGSQLGNFGPLMAESAGLTDLDAVGELTTIAVRNISKPVPIVAVQHMDELEMRLRETADQGSSEPESARATA